MKLSVICTAIAALAASLSSHAATCELQGKTYNVDTLQHYVAGPGVTFTRMNMGTNGHFMHVFVLAMDNAADNKTALKVVLGNDSCRTTEGISSMARRSNSDTQQIIGGTNADFFITSSFAAVLPWGNQVLGYPNMSCAIDGKIAAPDIIDITSRENALITDNAGGMWIDATDMTYKLLSPDGSTNISMTPPNFPREDNGVTFYNSYNGKSTRTTPGGREIQVRLVDGAQWRFNKSITMEVVGDWYTGGSLAIPADGGVISCGSAFSNEFVDALKAGDRVKVKFNLKMPSYEALAPDVKDVVGGDVRILHNGITTMEANRWINPRDALNPRTMVGFNDDHSHVVLCVIDGRSISQGSTYPQGGDLMRWLGCTEALNFDGGGSTEMFLSHLNGMANHPSDGSERAVANGLFVAINAPADPAVATVRFADWAKVLPKYGLYTPVVYGYNQYGQLIDTAVADYTLSAPAELGTITPDGHSLLASGTGTHALTVTYANGATATIAVTIDDSFAATALYPSILIDHNRKYTAQLQAQVGSDMMPVAPQAYSWATTDAAIAEVSDMGVISGKANGKTTVTATNDGGTATIEVNVEIPTSQLITVSNNPDDYKVSKTGLSTTTLTSLPEGLDIDMTTGSSVRGAKVTLTPAARLYSLPDAIQLTVNPHSLPIASIVVGLKANNATRHETVTREVTLTPDADNVLLFPVADLLDTSDIGIYPVVLQSLAFNLSPAVKTDYKLTLSGIHARYDNYSDGVEDLTLAPGNDNTLQVRVSGNTILLPSTARIVEVYNLTGTRVALAHNTDSLSISAPHGMYIVVADGRAAKVVIR